MLVTQKVGPKVALKFFKAELYKLFTSWTALGFLFATLAIPLCLAFAYSELIVASGSKLNRSTFFESLAISYIPIVLIVCLLSLTTFSQDYLGPGRDRLRIQANQYGQIFLVKTSVNLVVVYVFSSLGFLAALIFLDQNFNHASVRGIVSTGTALSYLLANEVPLVLIAFIATLISLSSSSFLQGLLHLFLMLLVLPAALGTLSVDGHFDLAWLTPLSNLQAISTFPSATPFTIQGLAPSSLTASESLTVLLLWVLAYVAFCWLATVIWPKRKDSLSSFLASHPSAKSRILTARPRGRAAKGKFTLALKSSFQNLVSDSTANRILIIWFVVAVGLTLLAYQRLLGQHFGMTPKVAELAFQDEVLGSVTQMESLFLAFLGVSLISKESSVHTLQVQLMAMPNRRVWLWSKICAYSAYFLAISLATFIARFAVATNLFQRTAGVGFQGVGMYLWFAVHCAFFGTCAGLLGVLFGLVIRSSLWSFLAVGSVFVIAPSLLLGFNQPLVDIGLPGVANSVFVFPFAALGVRWQLPNSYMPQFAADGRIEIFPHQEVLIYLAWLVLLLVGTYFRNRRLSL